MKISKKGVRILYDFANIVFGSFLFGMGMNMFMVPGEIVLGGFTGIATVLNILFSFPIGFTVIVLNIPPLLINGKLFGFDFFKRTIVGIITTSVAVDTLTMFPVTIEDPLLCSLFGGAIVGLGAGILLSKGYTTGGTDLIAWPIKNKIKRLSTGTAIMIIDFTIVLISAFALKNFEGIFYSSIATVVFSKIIDAVIEGSERGKLALVFSEHHDEIADEVIKIGRGVTILEGQGWYTKRKKDVLMCALGKTEVYKIKDIVARIDPSAFVVVVNSSEVMGEGFKPFK